MGKRLTWNPGDAYHVVATWPRRTGGIVKIIIARYVVDGVDMFMLWVEKKNHGVFDTKFAARDRAEELVQEGFA